MVRDMMPVGSSQYSQYCYPLIGVFDSYQNQWPWTA